MAKYIGLYGTTGDVYSALTASTLNRPFVVYTTGATKEVIFGKELTLAQVGDIVVYKVADSLLHYIPQANYNTTTYPTADYVPVGVVCAEEESSLIGGTGNIKFMGLNWLDMGNPDNGSNTRQSIYWGDSTVKISGLTTYTSASDVITDMNGKANTAAVLEYADGQADWRTASSISFTDGQRMFPLFECAWRYHTSGTSQGDWYVPAAGELYILTNDSLKLSAVNSGFTLLGKSTILGNESYFALSNEGGYSSYSFNMGWYYVTYYSNKYDFANKRDAGYFSAKPFCQMQMTAI